MITTKAIPVFVLTVILFASSPATGQTIQPKMGQIIVSTENVENFNVLDAKQIKVELWPHEIIPVGAATDLNDVAGQRITSRLGKGMPVMLADLQDPSKNNPLQIPPGKKVVAIKIDSDDQLSELLKPDDFVDVISVSKQSLADGTLTTTAKTILRRIHVFSTGSGKTDSPNHVIGLLVDHDEAERLVVAQNSGNRIKVVIRGRDDAKTDSAILDKLTEKESSNMRSSNLKPTEQQRRMAREAARELDRIAADLEDMKMYIRADAIRNSAHQLRLDARKD